MLDANGKPVLDYDLAIPNMLLHYFPTGMLGLGLTALLASFMSGMAGNVTAFNTVWTYDIYQSYIHQERERRALSLDGPRGDGLRHRALDRRGLRRHAASTTSWTSLQLVFAFVNAPLFATFLLGMFWKRTTGHGAFFGLLAGTCAAAVHHGLTLPAGRRAGNQGRLARAWSITYPSEMAQNFWTAIWAWSACFVVTIVVSLVTRPRAERELVGLVYSLTERVKQEEGVPWYERPAVLGCLVLAACCCSTSSSGKAMGLDIRLPIGLLFSIVGILLTSFGAFGSKEVYGRSLGYNVNLDWGLVLIVFGAIMLVLGYRGKRRGSGLDRTAFHRGEDRVAAQAVRGTLWRDADDLSRPRTGEPDRRTH